MSDPSATIDLARPGAASLAAATLALVGCAGPLPELDPIAVRDQPHQLDALELAAWVDANTTEEDFDEPLWGGLTLERRGDVLLVRGVIDQDSHVEMHAALHDAPQVATLVFTAVPGSTDDETNLALGRMLRDARVTTYLPAEGMIASGGTDLFLAGSRRFVETGARIGVHSWSVGGIFGVFSPSAASLPRDDPDHAMFLDYYRAMGIPEDFYWFTLAAALPEDIHWMTEAEIAAYGIRTNPAP